MKKSTTTKARNWLGLFSRNLRSRFVKPIFWTETSAKPYGLQHFRKYVPLITESVHLRVGSCVEKLLPNQTAFVDSWSRWVKWNSEPCSKYLLIDVRGRNPADCFAVFFSVAVVLVLILIGTMGYLQSPVFYWFAHVSSASN